MQAYYEKILVKKRTMKHLLRAVIFWKGWGGGGMTQGNVYLSAVFGLDYYSV